MTETNNRQRTDYSRVKWKKKGCYLIAHCYNLTIHVAEADEAANNPDHCMKGMWTWWINDKGGTEFFDEPTKAQNDALEEAISRVQKTLYDLGTLRWLRRDK